MKDLVTLSTVTPVYNGSQYLRQLVEALDAVRSELTAKHPQVSLAESIFVLDEPIDESAALLKNLEAQYSWISVVQLSKNFGQHPATICGILHSSSDWVVTLDEDLQHHPKYIIALLKNVVSDSSDVCYANSENSTHDSVIKDTLAKFFKRSMVSVLKNKTIPTFNSYRIIRGDVARAAASVCRYGTYFDIALGWFTKRTKFETFSLGDQRNIENTGESGYTFVGLVRHAKRMFLSSKVTLFRWGIPVGVFGFSFSLVLAVYAVVSVLLQMDTILVRGWASSFLSVLFFGGLNILLAVFILELISEALVILNGKPTFFVIDRSKDEIVRSAFFEN
jgi:glycosyltransferase involved in cell wall biosynthesis